MEKIFRSEYPRPQFVREDWQNLNGLWEFAFDDNDNGVSEQWFNKALDRTINVPFAFQSKNSGIGDPSYHDVVWYRKTITIDPSWKGKRIKLNFGAVDYRADVYVNGIYIGCHIGGHTPFSFDITDALSWESEIIAVRAFDPSTDETIPRGKQYWREKSERIWYTRTTGIWQTVWLEPTASTTIDKLRMTPDIDEGDICVAFEVVGDFTGCKCDVNITFNGTDFVKDTIEIKEGFVRRRYNLTGKSIFRTGFHRDGIMWSPEQPNLFDIEFDLRRGSDTLDNIKSYFGMRKIHTENKMVYLNNKPYYQKLVLDQGYWPDGLLTAPDDADYIKDIEISKKMGLNGCRKHQKIEDPRFLYWADKMGFLVWGECAAFVSYSEDAVMRLVGEWGEVIQRDYNHPCIVTWVPFNESWGVPYVRDNRQHQCATLTFYNLLHSLDGTRPVVTNDGWEMTTTDITAIHNYSHGNEWETEKFETFVRDNSDLEHILTAMPCMRSIYANGYEYRGEPVLLTEFGGVSFAIAETEGWGYTSASSEEAYLNDLKRIFKAVYASKILFGYCYTQLTDVEQEINGLVTYDRQEKCSLDKIKAILDSYNNPYIL